MLWNILWFFGGAWVGIILMCIMQVVKINDELNEQITKQKDVEEEDIDKHIPRID